MPLVSCPDCALTVSDQAPACPRCGRPLASFAAIAPPRGPAAGAAAPSKQVLVAVNLVSTAVIVLGVFGTVLVRSIGDRGPASIEPAAGATPPEAASSAEPAASATAAAKSASAEPAGELVAIPAGVLLRGANGVDEDEKPSGEISVAAFSLDATEVTVAAWDACVREKGCKASTSTAIPDMSPVDTKKWSAYCNGGKAERANHPMNCVDWAGAKGFCDWAKKRLPTETEWEYAARGVKTAKEAEGRVYPWGGGAPTIKLLNGCDRTCVKQSEQDGFSELKDALVDGSDGFPTTSPVRSFPANAFGLYDMAGNVSEWTASWHGSYDVTEVDSGKMRISRGGHWASQKPGELRTSKRSKGVPTTRDVVLGFRCAK